jgi:ribosomal protein S5
VVRATFEALHELESAEEFSVRTGKSLENVLENYTLRGLVLAHPA